MAGALLLAALLAAAPEATVGTSPTTKAALKAAANGLEESTADLLARPVCGDETCWQEPDETCWQLLDETSGQGTNELDAGASSLAVSYELRRGTTRRRRFGRGDSSTTCLQVSSPSGLIVR